LSDSSEKEGVKLAILILLILFAALGGFYLYVTKVEGRSFQSKLVEFLLRFGNKKYYANADKFVRFMEQKRIENLEPYQMPEKTRKKFKIARETQNGMECYILSGGSEPGRRQILYLHGGAYLNQPVDWHWNFLHDLSQKLDVTITVPIYPKAPHQHYHESFERVLPLYKNLLTRTSSEAVTIMGDSAGGGFGLALAQVALEKGIAQPGNIILISPWLDITLSNPEVPAFEKVDPMIARYGLVEIGKLYAGEQDPSHYMLSPINGEIKGLGQITIITGTHDLLHPEARSFRSLTEEQGVAINFFEYAKMNHCFPLFPIPEARVAIEQILDIIEKSGSR
jgi:acetyl esterase/lipase